VQVVVVIWVRLNPLDTWVIKENFFATCIGTECVYNTLGERPIVGLIMPVDGKVLAVGAHGSEIGFYSLLMTGMGWEALLKSLELNHCTDPAFGFSFHLILHQMCKLIVSEKKTRIKKFICDQLKCEEVHFTPGRIPFELRPLSDRHHAIALAMWLMLDLRERLASAWK
jgi:hypothetical protein